MRRGRPKRSAWKLAEMDTQGRVTIVLPPEFRKQLVSKYLAYCSDQYQVIVKPVNLLI